MSNYSNVEFRLGEIESVPAADDTVDVIMSNCVINLSPEKKRVFEETFRVLKSGGRLAVSDVVATSQIPEELKENLELYSGCISGAATIDELKSILENAGFVNIKITPDEKSRTFLESNLKGTGIESKVVSASIEAVKP